MVDTLKVEIESLRKADSKNEIQEMRDLYESRIRSIENERDSMRDENLHLTETNTVYYQQNKAEKRELDLQEKKDQSLRKKIYELEQELSKEVIENGEQQALNQRTLVELETTRGMLTKFQQLQTSLPIRFCVDCTQVDNSKIQQNDHCFNSV